jgi:hypothetical protein
MTARSWDVLTHRPALTLGMLAELAQLRAALPGYDVVVTSHSPAYRFEATSRPCRAGPGPWCVISTDPADLWRELTACTDHGANTATPVARAPLSTHPRPTPFMTAGSAKARHTAK